MVEYSLWGSSEKALISKTMTQHAIRVKIRRVLLTCCVLGIPLPCYMFIHSILILTHICEGGGWQAHYWLLSFYRRFLVETSPINPCLTPLTVKPAPWKISFSASPVDICKCTLSRTLHLSPCFYASVLLRSSTFPCLFHHYFHALSRSLYFLFSWITRITDLL